ncbi:MAG: alpha/beta hydrolase [Planctomycetes bacterium]|nr:alpha/beta hydrolase [Planctomycetota bacterium]
MAESESTPSTLALLQQLVTGARPPQDLAELNKMMDSFAPVLNADLPAVGPVHRAVLVREIDRTRVTADVIEPRQGSQHPVLLYLHGGGFVGGNPASHHKLACRFAEAGVLVFNLDYRLAPQHPFPAAFDDCLHAAGWVAQVADRYAGDTTRFVIAGDSAGANLAAAVAGEWAGKTAPRISAALLFYGVFDIVALRRGQLPHTKDPLLTPEVIDMLIDAYLGPAQTPELLADPRVSPIRRAGQMPPCFVVSGTADPLLSQSEAFVRELAVTGVPHEFVTVHAMPHGFLQVEFYPQARQTLDRAIQFLHSHLPPPPTP